ncbi:DegV family protein [Actinokineospora cianjurensis]|uniref:DegV family protein with EDD domain n=1 Tax=Actinokineospora cianjurensis TaxID=585224 RepID=A0A421AZB9_9PSEU|nr:DegV family protein [Actinokineospora cianjurensis]RLK55203.1 DegV family protein with EDD domain [Actinokineospora cianjurensis]
MPFAVLTDSTAYLPEGSADRHGVRVVPLLVRVDGREGRDGIDIGPTQLASALRDRRMVTTSRPSPAEFAENYRAMLDAGAEGVLSVHLSRELSGTWESARLAAEEFGTAVRVVDSRTTAMGLGFAVLRAAEVAATGAGGAAVEAAAVEAAAATRCFFVVETLEYLRRGGRIGAAAALLGTALAVKPILHVVDGQIVPLEKVRTTSRAVGRLVDLAVDAAGESSVRIAVHHLADPDRAADLADRLSARLPAATCVISELGAVIGAHTGPGVLGVVVDSR